MAKQILIVDDDAVARVLMDAALRHAGYEAGVAVDGPDALLRFEERRWDLVMLDVQGFPLMLHWYLVWRRHKRLPPVAQAFREFLLAEGARLIREVDPLPARVRAKSKLRPD